MQTKRVIQSAEELSDILSQADVQSRTKGVDAGYINQLLSYLVQQRIKDKKAAAEKLETLLHKMPYSGFAKRQSGRRKVHFDRAEQILTHFKVSQPLFELPLEDIIQILGWTARLMKCKEGGT
jgi:hypothetical protein